MLPNITCRGMLRIKFVDQSNPKDPGQQSDQLTEEIAVGNYNLNIALDAQELQLGPASKKVICRVPPPSPIFSFIVISGGRYCQLPFDR